MNKRYIQAGIQVLIILAIGVGFVWTIFGLFKKNPEGTTVLVDEKIMPMINSKINRAIKPTIKRIRTFLSFGFGNNPVSLESILRYKGINFVIS